LFPHRLWSTHPFFFHPLFHVTSNPFSFAVIRYSLVSIFCPWHHFMYFGLCFLESLLALFKHKAKAQFSTWFRPLSRCDFFYIMKCLRLLW
jgi:hypothetical protein